VYKLFASGSLVGACNCCYPYVNYLVGEHGKDCIYTVAWELKRHSLRGGDERIWDFRNFPCRCPDIVSLPPWEENFMAVCCLRNSDLTFIDPTFGNLREYWKDGLLILMLDYGMHEA
jgi:hypothetical protein